VTACKVTGPMFFEESNYGYYVEIILRLIQVISILLRIRANFLKEIVDVYKDRSFIVCREILSQVSCLLRSWRLEL
jgi:hypothetical protein